jgi:acyl carrier protein
VPAQEVVVDRSMLRVWELVFGYPVETDQDFFLDLGGNSLQALQLMDLVGVEFGVMVAVGELFDASTPAKLVAAVERLRTSTDVG